MSARVLAVGINASKMWRAVFVTTTFWLLRDGERNCRAVCVRVSGGTSRAGAFWLVMAAHAHGDVSTGSLFTNRSADAIESVAGFVVCAVFVVLTNAGYAGHLRVALGAQGTAALGHVGLYETLGASAAEVGGARVEAVFVYAGFVVWAVVVGFTFS